MRKSKSTKRSQSPSLLVWSVVILLAGAAYFAFSDVRPDTAGVSEDKASVALNEPAPEVTFTTIDGEQMKLSDFKGQRVMLWVFATWCKSCIAGAKLLEKNNDQLGNLTVIALETYGNAGYRGPTIKEFAQKYSPSLLFAQNWLWGNLSQEGTSTYNPKNLPDIYFFVDENGILKDIDTAPAATIEKIIQFAN